MMEQKKSCITVDHRSVGERLDQFLAERESFSRSRVKEWIQDERVFVNGTTKKASYKVREGDIINIMIPSVTESTIVAEDIPLDIYYEDQDLLVVNKPRGMVVHPGAGHPFKTLVNALLSHCKGQLSGIGGVTRPGIVHRIDKDTSGLIMVAKNDDVHQSLSLQLKEHRVKREYVAIVNGTIPHQTGTIDAPIGRDPNYRQQMMVVSSGKHAITHFSVDQRFVKHTLIHCQLETGRTHQIRVHMKYIGYPIFGDPVYGHQERSSAIQGQALHARLLGFIHPRTNEEMVFEAEMPQDMEQVLDTLRG